MKVKFEDVKNAPEINEYIKQADLSLKALGYTDHAFGHVYKCVDAGAKILKELGYDDDTVELVKIACYIHDIGNVINRHDHALTGAVMAFRILDKMGMEPENIARIITAIGNHDESSAFPVNEITAALILADKTDVRRSRVRNRELATFDIHDRVNYAVEESSLYLDNENKTFTLKLKIDTKICPVMDYFEIFLNRMILCRKAAEYFGLRFKLDINGLELL
jgi:metal-dependent HD superfamily phosphatase/phosphodiesterase